MYHLQELAVNLMGSKLAHPTKWSFMAPYIQSLPDSSALYGKYTFVQEHVGLLQDDKLARRCLMCPVHDSIMPYKCNAGQLWVARRISVADAQHL